VTVAQPVLERAEHRHRADTEEQARRNETLDERMPLLTRLVGLARREHRRPVRLLLKPEAEALQVVLDTHRLPEYRSHHERTHEYQRGVVAYGRRPEITKPAQRHRDTDHDDSESDPRIGDRAEPLGDEPAGHEPDRGAHKHRHDVDRNPDTRHRLLPILEPEVLQFTRYLVRSCRQPSGGCRDTCRHGVSVRERPQNT